MRKLTDIQSREDVAFLINEFYQKVLRDPQLAPFFKNIDWEHHTPVIIDFWCMILFGDARYRSNPFEKHLKFPLQSVHFTQWLTHFSITVDENFKGVKAEEIKQRAQSIAGIFQHKLGLV
jgi:hemoglobin